ncbi:MAG: DEAD/DEAH box helicase [Methanoregula sp.]|nr:DEAD/DEAH box helicase [Methanoregula sp.]
MYTIEEIRPILSRPEFITDRNWVQNALIFQRLGHEFAEEQNCISRLSYFVNCILSSAYSWDIEDGYEIIQVAAEIAELISTRPELSDCFRKKMRIRSAFLYELSNFPSLATSILHVNDMDEIAYPIFIRGGIYGKLGMNGKLQKISSTLESQDLSDLSAVDILVRLDCINLLKFEQGLISKPIKWNSGELREFLKQITIGLNSSEIDIFNKILSKRIEQSTRNNIDEKIFANLIKIHFPSELWQNQIDAIQSGLIEEKYDSWGFAAPTGTGKTFLTRLLILKTLLDNPQNKILYIVPSKALVHEVWSNLNSAFEELGYKAIQVTPQLTELDDDEKTKLFDCSIAVLTPEKADLLLRLNKEFNTSVSLIIVDEAHHLESDTRGILLELYLWRIKKMFKNQNRVIFLSAVTPNILELASWMGNNPNGLVVDKRSTRMRSGIFRIKKDGKTKKGVIDYFNGTSIEVVESDLEETKGRQLIQLAEKISFAGPVLIVAKGKRETEKLAKLMKDWLEENKKLKELTEDQINSEIIQRLDSRLEREMYEAVEMRNLIKNRIAYHHAGLPPRIRESVEKAIRENLVDYVFATTTLAEGVNFPFSSVIIQSLSLREAPEKGQPARYHIISPRTFWNIAGRAGRPGSDQEGQVILFEPSLGIEVIEEIINPYLNPSLNRVEPVNSALAGSIKEIIDGIKTKNFNLADINNVKIETNVSKRVKGTINLLRVGLVHAKASKLITNPEEILEGTFALNTLNAEERDFTSKLLKRQFEIVDEFLKNTDDISIDLIAELGLSIETLTEIRDYVKKLEDWQINNISKIYRHGEIDFSYAQYSIGPVASRMAELEGTKLGGILIDVIMSWLQGLPLLTMKYRARWERSPEELIAVIYSRIQFLLPWGLYAMHRIVQEEAKRRSIVYNDEILKIAYLVDAGVPSFAALQLANQDFERVDATRIAKYYRKYRKDTTIFNWVNAQPTNTIIRYVRGQDNRRLDSDLFTLLAKLKTQ